MQINVIIANVLHIITFIILQITGYVKNKKRIVALNTAEHVLNMIANFLLGSYPGCISNCVSTVRNITAYKDKLNFKAKIFFMCISTVLVLSFNNLGFIGLLPLASSIIYISFLDKDVLPFKYATICSTSCWMIHDIYIHAYIKAFSQFFSIILLIISIVQIIHAKKIIQLR